MKINLAIHIIISIALFSRAFAQDFAMHSFTVAGGSATITSGSYTMSGTVGQPDGSPPLTGGAFSVAGGFWGSQPVEQPSPIVIFDNSQGEDGGYEYLSSTAVRTANKFCLGSQSYQVESISIVMISGDNNGEPRIRSVRLQLFANDPSVGKPSMDTGVIMNLSGATNPIALPYSFNPASITWTPATPFTLQADTCYWAVFSVESGASVGVIASRTQATGDASSFGRVLSVDSGATWGPVDSFSNRKMTIRGFPANSQPAPQITSIELIDENLSLKIPSISGKTYEVQSVDDLGSNAWIAVPGASVSGTGNAIEFRLQITSDLSQKFYRLKVAP